MSIAIRPASLEADRTLIVQRLAQWLTPEADERRFDWLYRDNPAGEARVFFAVDDSSGAEVGVGAAFPRRLAACGEVDLGFVLGDFCIDPAYRTLGPALALQRACLSVVDTDGPAFCYDFPSRGMMAVYKRLRIAPAGEMVRMARPLRVDRKVREHVDVPGLSRALSAAGNLVLGLRDALGGGDKSVDVAVHDGPCGDEFDALADAVGDGLGLAVRRSAAYLSWRYLASTNRRHELVTARREGRLLAYAVFTCDGEDATLVDLFGVEDPVVLGRLVTTVVRLLRKRGAVTVSAPMWERHRWRPLMQELGFSSRDSTPVVVCGHGEATDTSANGERRWFLWQGDRDS